MLLSLKSLQFCCCHIFWTKVKIVHLTHNYVNYIFFKWYTVWLYSILDDLSFTRIWLCDAYVSYLIFNFYSFGLTKGISLLPRIKKMKKTEEQSSKKIFTLNNMLVFIELIILFLPSWVEMLLSNKLHQVNPLLDYLV